MISSDKFYKNVEQQFHVINKLSLGSIQKWRSLIKPPDNKIDIDGKQSVVTDADKEIEMIAIKILSKYFPDIPVLGEETFCNSYGITELSRFFVVDPIDGTSQFIQKNSEWSISLCLVERGQPSTCSIFMPDKNDLFNTSFSKEVYWNGNIVHGEFKSNANIAVSPRQIQDKKNRKIIENFCMKPVLVSALTPKICAILRGEVDAAVYFQGENQLCTIWDYAAAVSLLKKIGGRITSLTGEPLPFRGREIIHKNGWLASNNVELHNRLLSIYKLTNNIV